MAGVWVGSGYAGGIAYRLSGARLLGPGSAYAGAGVRAGNDLNPSERWRGARASGTFHRIFKSDSEATIPLSIPSFSFITITAAIGEVDVAGVAASVTYTYSTVTITAAIGEVDVSGVVASAVVTEFPATNITAAIGEVDVSGIAADVSYVYSTVTVTAAIGEVNVGGLAATTLSPISVTAAVAEIDIGGLIASVDVGEPAQSLTPGRIYPLPPGRRRYPVLPAGRNITVG